MVQPGRKGSCEGEPRPRALEAPQSTPRTLVTAVLLAASLPAAMPSRHPQTPGSAGCFWSHALSLTCPDLRISLLWLEMLSGESERGQRCCSGPAQVILMSSNLILPSPTLIPHFALSSFLALLWSRKSSQSPYQTLVVCSQLWHRPVAAPRPAQACPRPRLPIDSLGLFLAAALPAGGHLAECLAAVSRVAERAPGQMPQGDVLAHATPCPAASTGCWWLGQRCSLGGVFLYTPGWIKQESQSLSSFLQQGMV